MDRLAWMGFLFVVAACAPDLVPGTLAPDAGGGGGGAGGTGGSGGAGDNVISTDIACASISDCAALENECRTKGDCISGICWFTARAAGTPLAMQVYGDCNVIACDGKGNVADANIDNADKYVWGNPCYAPTCGTAAPLASNGACTTKWGTSGTCQVDFSCRECTGDGGCSGGAPRCQNGKCVPDHCTNAALDQGLGETDIDCGGPCAPCYVAKSCTFSGDCVDGGRCVGNPKTCQAPDCGDGIINGDETGVDCGGACALDPMNPKKCPTNSNCLYPSDCQSESCEAGVCK